MRGVLALVLRVAEEYGRYGVKCFLCGQKADALCREAMLTIAVLIFFGVLLIIWMVCQ